ncbi:hypothetical protein GH741_06945 [Aquibacillus halophilus]|uniref:PAC domain-containing protein n=1 Tax=Aquibacillus halophilus TaxID=930132 RepID=A0A6A8DEZ0_9BACI|nr:hypothetical protein [Aquibacillus halophilus]MRH42419.1 hypothetical protein [Aquibacillus halophilus]
MTFVPIKSGDPLSKDDQVKQGALNGRTMAGRPPFSVYGIHFYGKAMPIHNGNGNIIGALGIGYNIEDIVAIEETIKQLEAVSNELNGYTEEIEKSAELLSNNNEELLKKSSLRKMEPNNNRDQTLVLFDLFLK